MSTEPVHTIDPVAARRWAARPHSAAPWLHEEVARRMAERLPVIRLPVERWAHWEPARSGWQGHALVAAHYPQAQAFQVVGQRTEAPETDAAPRAPWWQRMGRVAPPRDTVVEAPPEGAMQLVWANMLAHQSADPMALLARWQQALAVDGFLMFSCLGPDTLQELRRVYAALGWPSPTQEFTDMHDWGDQLLAAGFADPVMDMETIRLSFETPARLLAELRGLGRNLHVARFAALRTPAWRRRLEEALERELRPADGGPLVLSFEVLYGHAVKPAPRHTIAARTEISLDQMRTSLRQRNRNLPTL